MNLSSIWAREAVIRVAFGGGGGDVKRVFPRFASGHSIEVLREVWQNPLYTRASMVLSDVDIEGALASGKLRIAPMPDFAAQMGACSLDLRLGNEFRVFERVRTPLIDPRGQINWDDFSRVVRVEDEQPFIMHPQELVLAATVEEIALPDDMLGRLEGRSSLGRLGIIVHGTAPMFFPGFVGKCVMELGNIGPMPVALYPGMRICSMTFETISSPSSRPYKGKYAGQSGPIGSKLQRDEEMKG